MLTICAEFPDIDVLWNFKGLVEAMAHHRGFTHSFVGAPIVSIVVLSVIYLFHRWRLRHGKSPPLAHRKSDSRFMAPTITPAICAW